MAQLSIDKEKAKAEQWLNNHIDGWSDDLLYQLTELLRKQRYDTIYECSKPLAALTDSPVDDAYIALRKCLQWVCDSEGRKDTAVS